MQRVGEVSDSTDVNVAILGLGWWGSKVLRNLCEDSPFATVFAFDTDWDRIRQAQDQWQFQALRAPSELWQRPDIHAVAIVTPPQTHFDLARRALDAGKHVMVAKPPAQSIKEAEQLCALAERNGLAFMVDSTFVFNPATLKVRDLVQQGLFPNLRFVQSVRCGDDLRFHDLQRILDLIRVSKMDVIEDLVFHDLSVLKIIFGQRFVVRSVRRLHILDPSRCDTAFIELDMNGVPVHIRYSWSLPERQRQLLLFDSEKFLLYDDLRKEKKIETYNLATKESTFPDYPQAEPLRKVVEHFYTCVAEGQTPLTGKDLILDVMRTSEEIQRFGTREGESA
jgi:predicted dehydrogenase